MYRILTKSNKRTDKLRTLIRSELKNWTFSDNIKDHFRFKEDLEKFIDQVELMKFDNNNLKSQFITRLENILEDAKDLFYEYESDLSVEIYNEANDLPLYLCKDNYPSDCEIKEIKESDYWRYAVGQEDYRIAFEYELSERIENLLKNKNNSKGVA